MSFGPVLLHSEGCRTQTLRTVNMITFIIGMIRMLSSTSPLPTTLIIRQSGDDNDEGYFVANCLRHQVHFFLFRLSSKWRHIGSIFIIWCCLRCKQGYWLRNGLGKSDTRKNATDLRKI